jgi:hypothetical protein
MGLFYSNFTVYGPDQPQVVDILRDFGRTAFVSPKVDGFTTIYDRETEDQDFEVIERVGLEFSRRLECPVLGVVLHDDDVLYLWLFREGEVRDFYNSCPDYFDADAHEPRPPEGGDADKLCSAFGQPNAARIGEILRVDLEDDSACIPGEEERHEALAKALGMPPLPVGLGYEGIEHGYLPERHKAIGLTPAHFVHIS